MIVFCAPSSSVCWTDVTSKPIGFYNIFKVPRAQSRKSLERAVKANHDALSWRTGGTFHRSLVLDTVQTSKESTRAHHIHSTQATNVEHYTEVISPEERSFCSTRSNHPLKLLTSTESGRWRWFAALHARMSSRADNDHPQMGDSTQDWQRSLAKMQLTFDTVILTSCSQCHHWLCLIAPL